jgi:hypothetical protein
MKEPPENLEIDGYIIRYKLRVTAYKVNPDPEVEDELICQKDIDYSSKYDRLWLGKFTVWALVQGYVVETEALEPPVYG